MNPWFMTTLIIGVSTVAIFLVFYGFQLLQTALAGWNSSVQEELPATTCSCGAGIGKTSRYYHAITCTYRIALEEKL
jgi:hypothetical protein